MAYAKETEVPVDRRVTNIMALIRKHGGRSPNFGTDDDTRTNTIEFAIDNYRIRMVFPDPDPASPKICLTPSGKQRTGADLQSAVAQARRSIWAAAELILKSRFEAVESGFRAVEVEFLPDIVNPDLGCTLAERVTKNLLDGKPMLRISA